MSNPDHDTQSTTPPANGNNTPGDAGDPDAFFPSQRYKLWLTIAILLSLGTLTISVVTIIIANARDEDQQERFETTLTAVWDVANNFATQTPNLPTEAPRVVSGEFPFVAGDDSPNYDAALACDRQVITGQLIGRNDEPIDGFTVHIWGDYGIQHDVITGELAGEQAGHWTLALDDMINRRLWVQVGAGERYLSAPVEITFTQDDCDHNQATIVFEQITPLR